MENRHTIAACLCEEVHPNEHYWFYAGKHEKREKNRQNMLGKKRGKKEKKHDKTWGKKGEVGNLERGCGTRKDTEDKNRYQE